MHEAPEINREKQVDEVPEKDLWGNVIADPLFPKRPVNSRIRKRASHNAGPAGETCGTCAHLVSHSTRPGRCFFKCGLIWNGGHSAASDIRRKHPSCGKWKSKQKDS